MSSRSTQIVGGPSREHAWVDSATNALLVKLVNPGGGGGTSDVNIVAVGGNAVTTTVPVSDAGGSLTVDGTVAVSVVAGTVTVAQATHDNLNANANIQVGDVDVANGNPVPVSDAGGSLTVDGTVAVSSVGGTVTVVQATHDNLNLNANLQVGNADVAALNPVPVSDAGGSLTVDGTVAVSSVAGTVTVVQATHDNLNLNANIQVGDVDVANGNPVPVSDAGGSLTVDGTVAVSSVSGTVTVIQTTHDNLNLNANIQVGNADVANLNPVPVSDAGGSLTVDGTVAVSAVGGTVTVAVAGTVTVVQATHDNLNLNSNIQVGNADVANGNPVPVSDAGGSLTVDGTVAVTVGTGATDLGKAEDAAHTTGDVGIMALAVRNDAGTALAGTTGDYIPLSTDSSGNLRAAVVQATHANLNATVRVQDGDGSRLMDIMKSGDDATAQTANGIVPMALQSSTLIWSHLFLSSSGGLLVSVDSVTPGVLATSLGKNEDAPHASADVGVMALAVRQDTLAALAGTTGDYIPLTTDSLGRLRIAPGTGATDFGKAEDAAHASGDVGIMALSVRTDTATARAGTDGDYQPLITDGSGRLHVIVGAQVPGTGATNLGKAEDAAHSSGDTGVMMLAVRQDTLAALAGTTGDYIPLTTDKLGRLNVRESGMQTIVLSGSTRGRPIQITGTASGSANTIHVATTTSTELDRLYLWLTNTSTAAVIVTIEFGTTGTGNELYIIVPAKETILAVNGAVIGGAATDTVKAYAATGSVVNAFGRVERLS